MDFKDTVHLPQTKFPMRAALAEREPLQVEAWDKGRLYEQLLANNAAGERFLLHDGPPYANGAIHPGHCLNKILKDTVVKIAAMRGLRAQFVPGWDCHGLPIEMMVDKKLGAKKRELSPGQFRRACRAFAQEQMENQRREFKRLGVLGDWDHPYLTMDYAYEAQTVRELARITRRGALYRRKKPVHWCPKDSTALAEAEVEYAEHESPSIYVAFDAVDTTPLVAAAPQLAGKKIAFAIWTTTPWTIPANLAIAAGPKIDYVAYQLGERAVIVAKELLASFLAACAPGELGEALEGAAAGKPLPLRDPAKVLAHLSGTDLAGARYRHPLLDRTGPLLEGEHATTEAGTGLVHTAPGHGEDDYRIGLAANLPIFAPVDGQGRFTDEAGLGLAGKKIFDANPEIVEQLAAAGALLNHGGKAFTVRHSYPHCWRCKQPVIFRATDQWWIGLDVALDNGNTIRAEALAQIDRISAAGGFIPAWGRERIRGMVEGRPDWCISRQRQWGVPIPVAYCAACREPLVSADAMEHVAARFEAEGADAWFDRPLAELLPPGSRCGKCGGDAFEKETDILDVWFDSGSSFAAVCEKRGLGVPADLYLEGSDQHRGWFMSALMIGVATRDVAPYQALLTHGFVVDPHGKKMSKSQGNFVAPEHMWKKYGAEVIRLWVAASDYRDDIHLSDGILEMLSEGYRKIRNTLRYCLSQLYDFDPAKDAVGWDALQPIDRWALLRLDECRESVLEAYSKYEFHRVYHDVLNFCSTELSAFYFDVLKDRTYCSGKDWPERRAAQTVLHRIGRDLARLLAPVASFTAEEVWQHLPAALGGEGEALRADGRSRPASVFLAGFPRAPQWGEAIESSAGALELDFALLAKLRAEVNGALEKKRIAKEIGKATEADVVIRLDHAAHATYAAARGRPPAELADQLLVATVRFEDAAAFEVQVHKSPHPPCARCWRALAEVAGHPDQLCARCAKAVGR